MTEFICSKCGQTAFEAGKRNASLSRVTRPGETPAQYVCAPSCTGMHPAPVGAHEEESE